MRLCPRLCILAALLLSFALPASSIFAQDDKLEAEVTALNNVRSDDAIGKKIEDLEKDKKRLRELIKAGLKIVEKKDHNLTYGALHILGRGSLITQDSDAAITFFMQAIEKANKVKAEGRITRNRYMLCRAYQLGNKLAEAEKLATKMADLTPKEEDEDEVLNAIALSKFFGKTELVRISLLLGKPEAALTHLEFLEKTFANTSPQIKSDIQSSRAQMYHFQGKTKEAIKIYEDLAEDAEDEEQKDGYRELVGNFIADSGDPIKGSEILGALLKKKPDDAGLNNDLGYILANHDMRLDEAEKMCRKAVELDPENSSYLDSLAWVFYKKKNYAEAKTTMEKALVRERARNSELYDHYGDILLALDQKKEAAEAFKKSIQNVTPSAHDQKIKVRAQEKLKKLEESK